MNTAYTSPVNLFIDQMKESGGLRGTDIANFTGVLEGHRFPLGEWSQITSPGHATHYFRPGIRNHATGRVTTARNKSALGFTHLIPNWRASARSIS